MIGYCAVLFSPDGDHITDFRGKKTIQEVWDCINDMGSKWIFYPISCVGTDRSIVDTPEQFEEMKRKRIKTVKKYLSENMNDVCVRLGIPLEGSED